MERNYSPVRVHRKGGTCKTKRLNLIDETVWCGLKAEIRKSFKVLFFNELFKYLS
jgi:hypothetical protein